MVVPSCFLAKWNVAGLVGFFFVLNFDAVDDVVALDLEGDGFSNEGLNEDLPLYYDRTLFSKTKLKKIEIYREIHKPFDV